MTVLDGVEIIYKTIRELGEDPNSPYLPNACARHYEAAEILLNEMKIRGVTSDHSYRIALEEYALGMAEFFNQARNMPSWHWGAFLIPGIFFFVYRQWGWFLLTIFCNACGLLFFVPMIIGGVTGWKYAYAEKKFTDKKSCEDHQATWAMWGVIVWVFCIILFLISISAKHR